MTAHDHTSTAAPHPRGCPPWCATDGEHGVHYPSYDTVTVTDAWFHRYSFAAYPVQTGGHAPHVSAGVSGHATAVLLIANPADARALAGLLDALALATPEQHRELAAQVRRAAGVLDGQGGTQRGTPRLRVAQCPATMDAGMPEGPERCRRPAHADSRHESPDLEWRDDDNSDGGTL